VLQWHFANDTGANTRLVKITFKLPPDTPAETTNGRGGVPGGVISGVIGGIPGGVPAGVIGGIIGDVPAPSRMGGKTLKMLRIQGLSDEVKNQLLSRLPVHEGDVLAEDSLARVTEAVRGFDEHMAVNMMSLGKENSVIFVISAPGSMTGSALAVTPNTVPPTPGVKRIVVGGNVEAAQLISQTRPVYPPLAKQARIQGVVKFAAVIAADGTMRDLQVISGHPLLVPPAIEAVKTWKYRPTMLEGVPVEVSTQIDVNFTLTEQQ